MGTSADGEPARLGVETLILEVALQAESGIAFREHLLIGGAVRAVADHAPFTSGLVLEHKGTALLGVAFHAGFIGTLQRSSATLKWAEPLWGSWQSEQVILPLSTWCA